eukprot:scaffold8451_cov251-Chaetoceros_neogracile.AAC.3
MGLERREWGMVDMLRYGQLRSKRQASKTQATSKQALSLSREYWIEASSSLRAHFPESDVVELQADTKLMFLSSSPPPPHYDWLSSLKPALSENKSEEFLADWD